MVGLCVALVLLAAACGSSSNQKATAPSGTAPSKPVYGGSLVVAVPSETDSWDPATAEWAAAGSLVGSSVLEPLAKLNANDGADPFLATSWIADANFDRWVINIRPGVTFSDGEKLDANAVKLNLESYIHGALTGQVLGPIVKDVQVVNPQQVAIYLNQPWAAFPSSYLDSNGALMMAPAMINSPDGGGTHPIGTGPFVFQSWTPGQTFVAKRNPTYWQKGLPYLDSITFKVITDPTTEQAALQSGDIDMALTQDASTPNDLAGSFTVVKDWSSESVSMLANTTANINGTFNPLSNIHARTALAEATDRRTIAGLEGQGVSSAGTGPFSPAGPWGTPDSQSGYPSYDPTKAKQQLAQFEQETGQPSLHFTLQTTPDLDAIRIAQVWQAQLKKVGITLDIESLDQPSLIKKLVAAEYEAVYLHLYSYPDPDTEQVFWSSHTISGVGGVNINFGMYSNPQMDQDLSNGRTSGYVSQRQVAYRDLAKQVDTNVLNIWLFRTPYSIVAAKDVHGFDAAKTIPFGNYQPKTWLADLWISKSS